MRPFLELTEAYESGVASKIQASVAYIRELVDKEIEPDIGDIDPDYAEDYQGNDSALLAAKYIVTLERSLYGQDDDADPEYLRTGLMNQESVTESSMLQFKSMAVPFGGSFMLHLIPLINNGTNSSYIRQSQLS